MIIRIFGGAGLYEALPSETIATGDCWAILRGGRFLNCVYSAFDYTNGKLIGQGFQVGDGVIVYKTLTEAVAAC